MSYKDVGKILACRYNHQKVGKEFRVPGEIGEDRCGIGGVRNEPLEVVERHELIRKRSGHLLELFHELHRVDGSPGIDYQLEDFLQEVGDVFFSCGVHACFRLHLCRRDIPWRQMPAERSRT